MALAFVHVERYELAAARRLDARASGPPDVQDEPLRAAVLALARARLRRAGNDLAGALEVLSVAARVSELPSWLADLLRHEETAVRVAAGQPPQRPGPVPVPLAPVDALLRSAVLHLSGGRADTAVLDLEHALRIAAPELSRRPFRQAHPALRRLLQRHAVLAVRHPWLVGGSNGGSGPPLMQEPPLPGQLRSTEPLTVDEREVLRQLARRRTSDEIAEELRVPVDVVRSRVRHIVTELVAT